MTRLRASTPFNAGLRAIVLCALVLSLPGCATTGPDHDPYESMNRSVYAFNKALDDAAIRPAAILYEAITPRFVSQAVTNFFGNLRDIQSVFNDLLQGKVPMAFGGVARVAVNSTIGLAGMIDVGSEMGLEKRNEDFGQTMGVWGMDSGPYLVLPFLGPSSVRDTFGKGVDIVSDPLWLFGLGDWEYAAIGMRVVDDRAGLLRADQILGTAAIDEYTYVRDAYLQRRLSQVHDGDPPPGADAALSPEE